jgi:hypothetical protein
VVESTRRGLWALGIIFLGWGRLLKHRGGLGRYDRCFYELVNTLAKNTNAAQVLGKVLSVEYKKREKGY